MLLYALYTDVEDKEKVLIMYENFSLGEYPTYFCRSRPDRENAFEDKPHEYLLKHLGHGSCLFTWYHVLESFEI
jgi:hypothetical protein